MFSAALTDHWLSVCGLLSWILVCRFDSAHGHLWGATGRPLCHQGSDPGRVQASSDELWGALFGRSESSGLWQGGSRWDRPSPRSCPPPHGRSPGRWELIRLSSDGKNSGKGRGWGIQQLLGLLQRTGNTVFKMDFLRTGESGEKCWVQLLLKTVFSEGLLSRPWCYGASSRLPASSLHWIVSVPQLDPCLEVDIWQF